MLTAIAIPELFRGLGQDIVYGFRSLKRNIGFTTGVVLTLALGLGLNVAMFSFLDSVYFRMPAGVKNPDEVQRVWTNVQFRSGAQFWSGFSYRQYAAIQTALGSEAAAAVYRYPETLALGGPGSELEVQTSRASASFFVLLGVRPERGRFYTANEDQLGNAAPVAVASYAFWQQRLGGDLSAVGRQLIVAGQRYTLIGIASAGFDGVELDATDLWLPLATVPSLGTTPWWQDQRVNGFQVLLRPRGSSRERLDVLEQRIAVALQSSDRPKAPAAPMEEVRLGSIIRSQGPGDKAQELKIATRLAGLAAIVLLIACANVINLLLGRLVRRRHEVALRLAVGASRYRLVRLVTVESIMLALLAAGCAILASYWGTLSLRHLLQPDIKWAAGSSALTWRVVGFAMVLGLVASVLVGIVPGIHAAATDIQSALRGGGGSGASAHHSGVRVVSTVVQTALSIMLLCGAGLFIRSLANVRNIDLGLDVRRLIYATVKFDTRDVHRDAQVPEAMRQVAERLRRVPSVDGVALARMMPMRSFGLLKFYPDVDTMQYRKPFATYNLVSPEFFAVAGIRVLRGTDFATAGRATPVVVVVNQAMAQAQWPGMNPLGRCLRFEPEGQCYRVIGVVATTPITSLREAAQAQFYLPLDNPPAEAGSWYSTLIVRTPVASRELVEEQLHRLLRETFPDGRPWLTSAEQILDSQYRPWRLGASLFSIFGILALTVAAVGIYGSVEQTLAERVREFGIRTALGAHTRQIILEVLVSSLRPVALGIAIGIVLALATGRVVASLLFGVSPYNGGVLIGAAAVMGLTAGVAAIRPAWRVTRVDPSKALRVE